MPAARRSSSDSAGRTRALPDVWQVFGLRESPFFQDSLGADPRRYPLELFVGRETETADILAGILDSSTSRQALGGAPGVGKTSLAQRVKAAAVDAGCWATRDLVRFHPDDSVESVMARILGAIHEAVITARPSATHHDAMRSARRCVRAFRTNQGDPGISLSGASHEASRSSPAVSPPVGMVLEVPSLIRALLDIAAESGARGVVLQLDDLENLADRAPATAADILRSLRDPVLLQEGLHVIVVGSAEAIASTVLAHEQLRSVFSVTTLRPLSRSDVHELLAERYRFLAGDGAAKVQPPVSRATVDGLHALFHGDLRGILAALETGVSALAGLVATRADTPVALADLTDALRARYADTFTLTLSAVRQRQLEQWAAKLGAGATPTQEELAKLWKVKQPAVSAALASLVEGGWVVPLEREGLEPGRYAFSGTSRIVLG